MTKLSCHKFDRSKQNSIEISNKALRNLLADLITSIERATIELEIDQSD